MYRPTQVTLRGLLKVFIACFLVASDKAHQVGAVDFDNIVACHGSFVLYQSSLTPLHSSNEDNVLVSSSNHTRCALSSPEVKATPRSESTVSGREAPLIDTNGQNRPYSRTNYFADEYLRPRRLAQFLVDCLADEANRYSFNYDGLHRVVVSALPMPMSQLKNNDDLLRRCIAQSGHSSMIVTAYSRSNYTYSPNNSVTSFEEVFGFAITPMFL